VQQRLHWVISAALIIVLAAYVKLARVPIHFNWPLFILGYWVDIASSAIFTATILYVVQRPEDLKRCWQRYWTEPARLLIIAIVTGWLIWWLDIRAGFKATVITIAVAEVFDVQKFQLPRLRQLLLNFMPPAVYFFFGIVLVFTYNDVILSVSPITYDATLLHADGWFLGGSSISELSRIASVTLPSFVFTIFDRVYLGLFSEIGAALVLVALIRGYKEGCRYVGTMLLAYYLALLIFYLYPTLSPYYLCPDHSHLPTTTAASKIEPVLMTRTAANQRAFALNVEGDYNIAFPCMHIALAVMAWWFCREWKRIARVFFVYNITLMLAILLLEWHYLVDLPAGIAIAVLVIAIMNVRSTHSVPAPARVAVEACTQTPVSPS
jgi:PAP2 superfamily